MANDLSAIVPQILAMGLVALREQAITVRLVNHKYSPDAGTKGSTIDVPIPSSIAARAVTPGVTTPASPDTAPTSVPITLDQWYEAPFTLSDKELGEINFAAGPGAVLPMQASEAIKALANNVDSAVLANYKKFYGWQGTAGTTPFASDISDATGLRKTLNEQLAPMDDRHVVFDPTAEAAALGLREFHDASFSGDNDAIINGKLNRRVGFDWWMNQNVPTHTAGTGADMVVNGTPSVGATTLNQDGGTGTLVVGDIFTIAGDTQTYVVTTANADVSATTAIVFEPGLAAAPDDNAAITLKATHTVNLGFHRHAIAFASRPLETGGGLGIIESTVDPISGLTLRLEVSRQHKQTTWSFDILYGTDVVRRELGARLAG